MAEYNRCSAKVSIRRYELGGELQHIEQLLEILMDSLRKQCNMDVVSGNTSNNKEFPQPECFELFPAMMDIIQWRKEVDRLKDVLNRSTKHAEAALNHHAMDEVEVEIARLRPMPHKVLDRLRAKTTPREIKKIAYTEQFKLDNYPHRCQVCCRAFVVRSEVAQCSACKHCFHPDCIIIWLAIKCPMTCPVCRHSVRM